MASVCVVHNKREFSNDKTCPACAACKHSSYFRTAANPTVYRCNSCVKTTKTKPVASDRWYLNENNQWEKEA